MLLNIGNNSMQGIFSAVVKNIEILYGYGDGKENITRCELWRK